MILLITAITPEAEAVRSEYTMKTAETGMFSLYESKDSRLRLLVTGAGKLSAAMAVTEYLARYSHSPEDVFCNLGIAGSSGNTSVGDGFLCASVTEERTGRSLYPELYSHPFSEARLVTTDTPVTTTLPSELSGPLPLLYDMEAYGVAVALFRKVMPSHCFFYKIVSDSCNGTFPSPEEVTALLRSHLAPLRSFLEEKEALFSREAMLLCSKEQTLRSLADKLTNKFCFSATMERKLTNLFDYALSIGFSEEHLLSALPEPTDTPHKKREATELLQALENRLLFPEEATKFHETSLPKKILHPFRHIYVEYHVLQHSTTRALLQRFPKAHVIPIRHYKDVFNRTKQDLHAQETEPALILAANQGTLFYPGAPVCQSFGEEHFMYTSCMMNCLYDCDYCYLQGMYPGKNLVVFVNLEDYFNQLDSLLAKHPVYLCCSYDSDLTALSGILPHAEAFCRYALAHPNLRLELRTKSAALPFIESLPVAKNIVIAFTLSPREIITRYEHYTPSLGARLKTAKEAAKRGFPLRLCFDPVLDVPNAPELYSALIDETFSVLQPEEVSDISLGAFRLSKDYLKQLKKAKPLCALSHYPYQQTNGVCHYRPERCEELFLTITDALHRHNISDDKLFMWTPEESGKGDSYVTK